MAKSLEFVGNVFIPNTLYVTLVVSRYVTLVVSSLYPYKVKIMAGADDVTKDGIAKMKVNPFVPAADDKQFFVDRPCIAGIQD
jgi:hypothetical protein